MAIRSSPATRKQQTSPSKRDRAPRARPTSDSIRSQCLRLSLPTDILVTAQCGVLSNMSKLLHPVKRPSIVHLCQVSSVNTRTVGLAAVISISSIGFETITRAFRLETSYLVALLDTCLPSSNIARITPIM